MNQLQRPVIVVLGAAGFVGRHTCRILADQGNEVIGLGHGDWHAAEWETWGLADFHRGDIDLAVLESLSLRAAPASVIHCGGSAAVSYSYAQPFADFQRAVDSTAVALEWVRRTAPETCRLVMVSSAAIYGDQGDVDLVEENSHNPISPYGFHKVMAENLCNSYARFFGLKVSIVRLFSVYGTGLRKQLLWDAVNKFTKGENRFFGTGHELRDWIHVTDAAALLGAAATRPQRSFEIYNGGHSKRTTSEILTALGAHFSPATRPEFTGATHSGNPRRLTSDSSHANHQLGWAPSTAIDDGLRDYAGWFRALQP